MESSFPLIWKSGTAEPACLKGSAEARPHCLARFGILEISEHHGFAGRGSCFLGHDTLVSSIH